MTTSITQTQGTELQLKRLAAQRKLYSRAKEILSYQMIVTVVLVVVWSVVVLGFPALRVYAALWGVLAVVLDFALFTPLQSSLKGKAAGIQELFDCDVLVLPWQEIKAGAPPDTETVAEWSHLQAGQDSDTLKLRTWYPVEAGEAPLPIGRLICQRANCWWDAKLRRRYAVWVVAATAGIFMFAALVGLLGCVTLEQFLLAGLMPFLPVFVIGIRQFTDQRQAATRLDDLKKHSERLWREALSADVAPDELTRRSRTLQDEIFEQRRRNPLIFDWVYRRLRDEQEELMNRCAGDLLQEARAALVF
jgi:hypothetical protein